MDKVDQEKVMRYVQTYKCLVVAEQLQRHIHRGIKIREQLAALEIQMTPQELECAKQKLDIE